VIAVTTTARRNVTKPVRRSTAGLLAPTAEPLRYGFTLEDVEETVQAALRFDMATRGLDRGDRYEAAWFAVVDRLYSDAAGEPSRSELLHAAHKGLTRLRLSDRQTRGFAKEAGSGPESAPGFARYWKADTPAPAEDAGFVASLVDRLALRQIFDRLGWPHRQALLALALHRDYARAAQALQLTGAAFQCRLNRARQEFAALWFGEETPGSRRPDQRTDRHSLRPRVAAVLEPDELCSVVLPDARAVFAAAGAERMPSAQLLARLAERRPGVYAGWDQRDLGQALRLCGVPPADLLEVGGQHLRAYHRDRIEDALDLADDADRPDRQDVCDIILAAWLQAPRPGAEVDPRGWLRHLVTDAGARGITTAELLAAFPGRNHKSINNWLRAEIAAGHIVRVRKGRYATPQHAAAGLAPAEHAQLPAHHPRAQMLALIEHAGPGGITTGTLLTRLDLNRSTLTCWLREEVRHGTITRQTKGRYIAADHARPGTSGA
jgi:hypothetical protein